MKEIRNAHRVALRTLHELSFTMQQIQELRAVCSTRMKAFFAIAEEAEEGALRSLSSEISLLAASLSAMCLEADARCEFARMSLLDVLRRLLLVEARTPAVIFVTRACQTAISGLDQVEEIVKDAQNQLMEERDSLLELALLHDASPKVQAVAEAVIQHARHGCRSG